MQLRTETNADKFEIFDKSAGLKVQQLLLYVRAAQGLLTNRGLGVFERRLAREKM
jgi:hypothetical protein